MSDKLQRFLIDNTHVRGELVQLDQVWQTLQATASYPIAIRTVLGEALAAVALLATTIKFKGSLVLQINATKPVQLLVVQASHDHNVRGLVRCSTDISDDTQFTELFAEGHLTISIEPKDGGKRYQSIVALEGESLADSLAGYFATSEQLPTRLWLAADDQKATGLLLQRLPTNDQHLTERDDENWQRALALTNTISHQELLTLDAKMLLQRLYHEEELRLFDSKEMAFKCQCSQKKVEAMVVSLGEKEGRDMLKKKEKIEITCEFCNYNYVLDQMDIARLFKKNVPSTDSIH